MNKSERAYFNTCGVWLNPDSKEIFDANQVKEVAEKQIGKNKERVYGEILKNKGFQFFGSKLEANCYLELLKLFNKEEIFLQPKLELIKPKPGIHRGISWKPDFCVIDSLKALRIFVEAKGFETEAYRIKRTLFLEFVPMAVLIVAKKPTDVQAIKTIHSKFTIGRELF